MRYPCIECNIKGYCNKVCPVMTRLYKASSPITRLSTQFSGESVTPFIGTYGYPKVNLGILAQPYSFGVETVTGTETGTGRGRGTGRENAEAWKSDAPTYWYKKNYAIAQIVEARARLLNSREPVRVTGLKRNKMVDTTQEIALASIRRTPETEFSLKKKPSVRIRLSAESSPVSSVAEIIKAEVTENVPATSRVERIVDDTDLKAAEGVHSLYERGVDLNNIMRLFSVGLLGMKKNRRLVPTRYSITGVDDILGKRLAQKVKDYPEIDVFRVFNVTYIGNHYEILFLPGIYEYELVEMWTLLPSGGSKNKRSKTIINSNYEPYWGRKTYARETAGAFYAGRLACLEYLNRIKRCASMLVIRNVSPEYNLPVGIWQMREACRGAFLKKPVDFSSLKEALSYINSRIAVRWMHKSKLLKNRYVQRRLKEFLGS